MSARIDAPRRASLVVAMKHAATFLKKTIPESTSFGTVVPVYDTPLADFALTTISDHGKLGLDDEEKYDPQTHMRIHCQSGDGKNIWCTLRRNAKISELKLLISCEYASSPEQLVLRVAEETLSDDRRIVEVAAGSLHFTIASPQRMATGSARQGVRIYDLGLAYEECKLGSETLVNALAWDPNGVLLAAGSGHGSVDVFDVYTGDRHNIYKLDTSINSLVWSPDGSRFVLGADDGSVHVYNFNEQREETKLCHPLPVHSVGFSWDGRRLATGCADDNARIWLLPGADKTHILAAKQEFSIRHGMPVLSVAWRPRRQCDAPEMHLATGSGGGLTRLFDVSANGQELFVFRIGCSVNAVKFDPTANLLAVASDDCFLRVFDVNTGCVEHKFAHGGNVTCCSWDSAGRRIATGASDGFARVLHLFGDDEEVVFDEGRFIYSVAYCPDVSEKAANGLIDNNISNARRMF